MRLLRGIRWRARMPTLKFKIISEGQLDHIYEAIKELGKAGVDFDTGYLTQEGIYEWSLDWSLKGAELIHEGKVISK